MLTRRWKHPNLSISGIEGTGTNSRIISRKATAKVSIRHVPNQQGSEIISELVGWLESNFAELKSCNTLSVSAVQSYVLLYYPLTSDRSLRFS